MKNAARKLRIRTSPRASKFLDLLVLFNFETTFIVITEGKMPMLRSITIPAAPVYSVPITERIAEGAVIRAAIIGAVNPRPNLRLPKDKSEFNCEDAGIDMNARLDEKLPTTMVTIIAK